MLDISLKLTYDILILKKKKTKKFPFCTENKIVPKDNYTDYMKNIKPKKYTKVKKLICDWTIEESV